MVATGCQVVPKADPSGDEFSWRLSFSRGELLLAQHVSSAARTLYVSAKLFWKEKLKTVCPSLRSYHVKTLFYHFLEATPVQQIEEVDTENMLRRFLAFIHSHLEARSCPHFFIPTLNLFHFTFEDISQDMINMEISSCLVIIHKFRKERHLLSSLFSKKSKSVMRISKFKNSCPYLYILGTLFLVIINIIAICLGAAVYVSGLFSLVSLLISFVYGSIVSIPVIILSSAVYYLVKWCQSYNKI